MKYTKQDIKDTIQSILDDVEDLKVIGYTDWDKYKNAETLLWDKINDLHKNAIGLVGKNISFQIADGYANYIIVKENKRSVTVQHLDIGDGYQSPAAYGNTVNRELAERYVKMNDGMKAIFG